MEITVRGAVAGDIRVLVDFNLRMAEETEGKSLDGETLAAGVEAVVVGTESEGVPTGRYLVAEVDGRVVGALMHTWEWSDWRNGVVWWLQSVFVVPEFRDIDGGIPEMIHRLLDAANIEAELRVYRVWEGELPGTTGECDAWLTSGSRASVSVSYTHLTLPTNREV